MTRWDVPRSQREDGTAQPASSSNPWFTDGQMAAIAAVASAAGVTPQQLATALGASHDTDPEREGFIPARLSALALRAASVSAVALSLAANPDSLIAGAITRDANGAATAAPVRWPDGTAGLYTATTVSTAFPGAVDAYTITYGDPATKTFMQAAITRDADGAVVTRPALVVS